MCSVFSNIFLSHNLFVYLLLRKTFPISDLEGAEEQVVEEADEAQQRFPLHGLVDNEGEQDGVNP